MQLRAESRFDLTTHSAPTTRSCCGPLAWRKSTEQPFRINPDGFLELPIVGRVKASGLTIRALEADLVTRLREYIREPQVYISLVQFRSEPVFFVGSFRSPGLYPLQGGRGLIEMMSTVGGLVPNASRRIRITRRAEDCRPSLCPTPL